MKKILLYTIAVVLGALTFASCNLNEYPVFDDSEAFVAFDASSYSFDEANGLSATKTVEVTVTLASVEGIATTISYEAVDSTAIAGYDYDLVDETGTLSFDPENRTATIQIVLYGKDSDRYTGSKVFTLRFRNTGSVNAGHESTATITITDLNHPLTPILGTYTMTGVSYFNGDVTWNMNIERDESDVTLVWLSGLVDSQTIGGFYGTVESVDGMPSVINITLGQQSTQTTSTCILYGMDAAGEYYYTSGNMPIEITNGGQNIEFTEYGPSLNAGGNSFYGIILAGATGVKQ